MADGAGITRGADFRIRATFVDGGRPVDFTNRSVSCEGRIEGQADSFGISASVWDSEAGEVDLFILGGDTAGSTGNSIAFEFTITGTPQINGNEKPLVVPLRDRFAEAQK